MKKTLAWICIALTGAAFIMLCLVLILRIQLWIPIIMFAIALVMLAMIKRMPGDERIKPVPQTHDMAFFDTDEAFENTPSEPKGNINQQKKHKR